MSVKNGSLRLKFGAWRGSNDQFHLQQPTRAGVIVHLDELKRGYFGLIESSASVPRFAA